MNYNESFMSVDMNDNEISGDFYNDEGMDDNNELELVKSQVFKSWKAVDYWLKCHGQELGFAFSITHSENDKSDKTPRWHVYMCTKEQRYVPYKEAHILGERDQDHKTIGCSFHINLYQYKNDNQICILSIVGTYNHEMIQNITMVESRYRRLTKEMQDDVRLLMSCGVRAGSIIKVLQQKNPENTFMLYCEMNRSIHYRAQLVNLVDEFQRQIANEVSIVMFADDMFDAFVIELEELISDLDHELCEKKIDVANQPVISAMYNNNFGSFEHCKRFGIMKKVLDLSIAMRWYKELYKMHLDLMKEMEMELKTENNHNNFITTINNPIDIHSKSQKQKNANLDILKSKTGSAIQIDSTQENYIENSSLSSIADKDLNYENMLHYCGICGQSGHNAHTCNSNSKNKPSNNIVRDYFIDQENINSVENSDLISIVDKNSIINRLHHCGTCGQAGHNT
ncbi:15210_t:CDS:10, partial [Cetraspora pellucida]